MCSDILFTAFDPPRVQVPATALDPIITASDPRTSSKSSILTVAQDPSPEETLINTSPPSPAPVQSPEAFSPAQTSGLDLSTSHGGTSNDPEHSSGNSMASSQTRNPNLDLAPHRPATSGNPLSLVSEDPRQEVDPKSSDRGGVGESVGKWVDPVSKNPLVSNGPPRQIVDLTKTSDQNHGEIAYDKSRDPGQSFDSEERKSGTAIGNQATAEANTINGQEVQPLSDDISIAGVRLRPGASPMTLSEIVISVSPSTLFVGASSASIALPPVNSIAGQGTTLIGQAITHFPHEVSTAVSGTPIYLGETALVMGLDTTPFSLPQPSSTSGHVLTINGQGVQPLTGASRFSDTDTTLIPGAAPTAFSSAFDSISMVNDLTGNNITPSGSEASEKAITTVARQALTAGIAAVKIASVTLIPETPGTTINGTLVSLNSNGELALGFQTIELKTRSEGLGGLILGGFATLGPFATGSPGAGIVSGNGTGNRTSDVPPLFEGKAGTLQSLLSRKTATVFIAAIALLLRF